MALILNDRVKETTTTSGTNNFILGGAVSGYQAFSVIGNGSQTYYACADQVGTNWEVGIGTYVSSTNTLSRDTILSSSNGGAKVAFGTGTKDIFVTYPSERALYADASNNISLNGAFTGTFNGTVGATTPSTGAFTTLSASSTVSGTGFSTYLASPPAIGATAANTGAFTTLSASSTVTLSNGTANGVLYLNGSKDVTSGSALTFDGTNFTSPRAQFTTAGSSPVSGAGVEIVGGTSPVILAYNRGTSAYLPMTQYGSAFTWSINGVSSDAVLTSTGLGIGTSSPAYKLEVYDATNPRFALSTGASGNAEFRFATPSSGYQGLITYSAASNFMAFYTSASEQMRLNSTGLSTVNDATIHGITVGLGGGSVGTNTAFGLSALGGSNSGSGNNTAIGYASLLANTTGAYNTATGLYSLVNNTSGSQNSAFGYYALLANTTGSNNTAFGYQSLNSNNTASNNTAVGYQAGYSNTTGAPNTFVGAYAGLYSTGANNTGVGYSSLGRGTATTTTGANNTAIGDTALYSLSSGNYNTAVGVNALLFNTTASNNTAVGYQAGFSNTTGAVTAFGYSAGSGVTTGSIVAIGVNAGNNLTTGSNGIYLGTNTQPSAVSNTYEIVIGTGSTGKGSSTGFINPNGGGVYQGNNSASWSTTSDARIKENVVDLASGLSVVNALRPVEFDYIETKKHDIGWLAQEFAEVLPDQVSKHAANQFEKELVGEDEIYGINPNLIPYLVKAIQELSAKVDAQAAEIAILKGK